MFFCSKCQQEVRLFSKLISHYRFAHGHEQGFFLICSVEGCEKQYNNVDSYLKHVKRKHKVFYQGNFSKFRDENRTGDIADCLMEVNEDETEDSQLIQNACMNHGNADFSQIDFQKRFGIFFLQLRETYKLPSKVLPVVINEILTMISHHQASLSHSLVTLAAEDVLDQIHIDKFKQILNEKSAIENALSNLDSEYKINKFARFHLNYVKPIEFKPDRNQADTYQYVPVLETIKNLLSHDDVFSYVINSHKSHDGILRDFCDGDIYSRNPFFRDNPSALQVMLFFDEFTAANPLGHQVKNYKIAGFYMLLGNLPPKYRSQLYCIQLVALCHSTTLKRNGFAKILEPLISDLKLLETDGISISKNNVEHLLYGTLSVLIADNLGAHGIGGFMESFTTLRNCRFCFIDRDRMQTKFDCFNLNLRTVQMYNEQTRLVQDDATLASVYGVKFSSPLNDLDQFHVIHGMPSDIAHDLFEGVVCDVMTNVIKHCVVQGYFSLQDLNEIITRFKFSDIDKSNRPAKVKEVLRTFKVHQSASQTWCFVRFLPLFIGNKVPVNDQKWESLLLLRDMLLYVCAPALNRGHILSMSDIINEFHESYRASFQDDSVKPKFHYTLHYPHLMCEFGPLLHLQTLRFEAKHNYFKELVFRSKNKKNMCKSLAERHQYYTSSFNTGGKFLSSGRVDSTGGNSVPIVMLNNDFQRLLIGIVQGDEVFLCNSVEFLGITYWKNTCVITGLEGFMYQFSKIIHCAIIQGQPYLLCQKLRTRCFERHFHAFAVEDTFHYEVLRVSEIPETNPIGIYEHPNPVSRYKLVVPKLVMDRKFITIKFGSQNKKIAVEEINYRTILGIVKERFTVKSPDIKYFDTDVDDWVDFDIDSDEYVSEVKVLKLIVNEKDVAETDDIQISADKDQPSTPTHTHMLDSQLQRPGMPISTPSRSSTPTRPLTPSSSSSSRPLTPLSSSSSSSRPLTPSTSTSATTSSDNASKCSARTAEYYTNNKLWCRQYKIPRSSISRSVLVKLESKDELTTAERRNMLDGVYNDVTRYSGGMYPTSEMYEDIVDGLMREYPYLLTYRDLPPAAAREFWKDKIIYKFGNARKVLDKDHPDVKLRKKNVAGNTEKKAEEITTFTWGLAKYLPELPVTEDDTSFEIHIKWLQREFKKTDPDTDGVDTKMQLTFPYRRKLVVEEKISVTDLLEQFPWLTSRHELLKEFERLEPNTVSKNLVELLTDGLQKYRKAIVSLLKKKKKPDFLSEIDQASRHFRAEGQRNYADDCMALAGIPLLFKEKPDTLMCKGEGVPMGIKINSQMMTMDDNSFSVYAEETEVFKCDSFFEAYSGLLACIYVMNLAYPKGLDKTFSFVQNILLGLRDDTSKNTVDRRIVNVLSLLNAEIKKS